jgi:hypothetical protein
VVRGLPLSEMKLALGCHWKTLNVRVWLSLRRHAEQM